jgi:uncharacterized ubiquitin-like protein YukD
VIEITLTFRGKQIDLLVPGGVTFDRLTGLIGDAFADKGIRIPSGFSLALDDKALVVAGADLVSSVGVADGDRLQIMTKE